MIRKRSERNEEGSKLPSTAQCSALSEMSQHGTKLEPHCFLPRPQHAFVFHETRPRSIYSVCSTRTSFSVVDDFKNSHHLLLVNRRKRRQSHDQVFVFHKERLLNCILVHNCFVCDLVADERRLVDVLRDNTSAMSAGRGRSSAASRSSVIPRE